MISSIKIEPKTALKQPNTDNTDIMYLENLKAKFGRLKHLREGSLLILSSIPNYRKKGKKSGRFFAFDSSSLKSR